MSKLITNINIHSLVYTDLLLVRITFKIGKSQLDIRLKKLTNPPSKPKTYPL